MKFGEYILEELNFDKWKLKKDFLFKKNKVVKIETKKFSLEEISFLFSLSMSFGLDFKEKDSNEILNFFIENETIKPDCLEEFMLDSNKRKNAWKKEL